MAIKYYILVFLFQYFYIAKKEQKYTSHLFDSISFLSFNSKLFARLRCTMFVRDLVSGNVPSIVVFQMFPWIWLLMFIVSTNNKIKHPSITAK
ncbi:hypothetical protein LDENG_00262850, partial [Lucifuga dentata]